MPEKKKSAAKKTVAKNAVRKAATKKVAAKKTVAKKAAAKKTAAKKTSAKKAAAKKTAVKKAVVKKTSAKKSPTKKPATQQGAKEDLPKASELLKRTKHHTPAIFKVGSRKAAPVIFSLEDVRAILKQRAKEEPKEKPAAKAAKKAAVKKAVQPLPDTPQQTSKHAAASLSDILGFGGAAIGAPPPQRTIPRKWKKYHTLLLELRSHVRQSLGMHAEDTLKRSQKEDSGDLSTSSDAGTDTFDRDFALSVVSSEQEALKEIEDAIERIHKGTYGVCEITSDLIASERLEAVPFTRYSLEGQRQYELTARRRVSRSGAFLSEGAEGITFGDDNDDS